MAAPVPSHEGLSPRASFKPRVREVAEGPPPPDDALTRQGGRATASKGKAAEGTLASGSDRALTVSRAPSLPHDALPGGGGGPAGLQAGPSIWWFALGYFATYVPYSALTKALSDGLFGGRPLPGLALLPISNVASMLSMAAFLSAVGWWKYAGRGRLFGVELPRPGLWTFLSGLGTAAVVATTTLAYTFRGASIVFMMLLMRGGVLVLAPAVDLASGRHVRWFSWLALALSLASLLAAFAGRAGFGLPALAALDVAVYLAAYFVRLRLMSRLAKADDPDLSRRYFVEEQMVATPAVVLALALLALAGPAGVAAPLRQGFMALGAPSAWLLVALVGVLSQGNGIFGGLVLLDRRENSFCVPVNRASSMLAGLGATLLLWALVGEAPPSRGELVGALFVAAALGALSLPDILRSWRAGCRSD